MFVFSGKSACKGIAMGSVLVWKKEESPVPFIKIEDAEYEMQRVNQAVEVSKRQLQEIYEKALGQVGEEKASIFTVYRMLLEDKGFLKSIFRVIQEEKATAEYAVEVTKEKYVSVFDGMTDEYMKTRAEDIKDISRCLIWNLKNCGEVIERAGNVIDGECENDRISAGNVIHEKIVNFDRANKGHTDRACTKKFILITDELTPAEMIQIDKSKILAFVTVHGSINSHTAILARTMNIPALIGAPVEPEKIENGMQAIVDGFSGKVILEPTE